MKQEQDSLMDMKSVHDFMSYTSNLSDKMLYQENSGKPSFAVVELSHKERRKNNILPYLNTDVISYIGEFAKNYGFSIMRVVENLHPHTTEFDNIGSTGSRAKMTDIVHTDLAKVMEKHMIPNININNFILSMIKFYEKESAMVTIVVTG